MEKVPRVVYTREFKEEAVKMVTEAGLSVPEVARRISVGTSTVAYWIKLAKEGRLSDGRRQRPVTGEEMELARLKRENAELKTEVSEMEKVPRAVYTKEFKEEAVKMVREAGLSVPEVARRISVGPSTIAYWVKLAKEGRLGNGGRQRPVTGEEMELARLKRENAELKMEREILKKATAFFAKESSGGSTSSGSK